MGDTNKAGSRLLPLVWAERSMNLVELVSDVPLPAVVKMQPDGKVTDTTSPLSQPLLLYREQKSIKVVARNVSSLQAVSKDGVEYKEGASTVFLPVDYQGWFRMLEDETVPLNTISNVARHMPVSFMSAKKVPGFSLLDPTNAKNIMYEKLQYPPGVYYVHNIFEDYVKYNDNKNVTKRKLLRCLVCISEDGLDALLPFDVEGEFYIVEARQMKSKGAQHDKVSYAYTLKQLVTMGAFTKPVVLQILKGQPPNKPCGFTGIIKVCDIVQERTIVAATLDGTRKLMELPVLPFPQFVRALNGKDLLETGSLRSELLYMSSGAADRYVQEIKISVPLQQKDKQSLTKPKQGVKYGQPSNRQSPSKTIEKTKGKWTYVKPSETESPRISNSLQATNKKVSLKPLEEGHLARSQDRLLKGKYKDVNSLEDDIYIQPFGGRISVKPSDKSTKPKVQHSPILKDVNKKKIVTSSTDL